MGTAKVHFTLGEGFGQLLVSIAREQLLYSLQPTKAINTIKDSLVGCNMQIALQILIGKLVLLTDRNRVSVNIIPYTPNMKEEYPPLDIEGWAERTLLTMKEYAIEWDSAILELRRAIIRSDGEFHLSVRYDSLVRFFYSGDSENLIDPDQDIIGNIKCTVIGIRNFIEECFKKLEVIKWLSEAYPGEVPDGYISLPVEVRKLNLLLTDLMLHDGEVEQYIAQNRYRAGVLDRYLQNEREIQNIVKNGIQPVDIIKGYSAGWLAPNGDFYGLNGEIANMLHNQIASALKDAGVIPRTEKYENNPDGWLCRNGWVKIHGDHILYDGYMQSLYGMPLIEITEEQRNQIALYGKFCHNGMLRFGIEYKPVSVARFEMTNELMIRKLFDFDV